MQKYAIYCIFRRMNYGRYYQNYRNLLGRRKEWDMSVSECSPEFPDEFYAQHDTVESHETCVESTHNGVPFVHRRCKGGDEFAS